MPNEVICPLLVPFSPLHRYPEAVRMMRCKKGPSSKNINTELQKPFILRIKLEKSLHLVSEERYISRKAGI